MAVVRPFKGVVPKQELAEQVACLPYDVMNREEATEMAKDNPYSFLHICRSEIDLPEVEDVYSPEVYKKAKESYGRRLAERFKSTLSSKAYEVLSNYELTTVYAPDTSSCVDRILKEKNED